MKNLLIALSLLIPLLVFNGCSKDEDDEKDLQPKNTSYSVKLSDPNNNMPSGGIATSQYSDSPTGEDIGKSLDNDVLTNFATEHSKVWLIWKGDSSAVVNRYSITSASNAPEKDPKSWTLYGSSDSLKWIIIDTQINQTFPIRTQKKSFDLRNKDSYKYYRLSIVSNQGDLMTQFAEWTLQAIPPTPIDELNIDDLMKYSSGSSYSSKTPMGSHYENRHVATDADRIWLNKATNEPQVPASAPDLHWTSFAVNLYPFGAPSPADINQKSIGDCGGIAAMASMAYIHPDYIKKIIKDNGNATYTVSMFDPQGNPITVTLSSKFLAGNDNKLAAVSGKNDRAVWSTVLEKAIMKYNSIFEVNTDIGGIGSEHVIPLFTGNGNSIAFSSGKLTAEQLKRAVEISLAKGKFIVGGFNQELTISPYKTVTGHAFTLMLSTDPTALFTMRNPWGFSPGSSNGSEDGVLNIPNNDIIPPSIDLRIIDPGEAGSKNAITPYVHPNFVANKANMRVDERLMQTGR